MILLVHLLFGAAIGSVIKNIWLAIILSLLGHYFLDLLPHADYSLKNIENAQWKKAWPDFIKIFFDLCFGFLVIFIFSKNQLIIYTCAFVALLPDGLTLFNIIFPNRVFKPLQKFHQKIHFLKDKKISNLWRIFTQVVAVIISIILINPLPFLRLFSSLNILL